MAAGLVMGQVWQPEPEAEPANREFERQPVGTVESAIGHDKLGELDRMVVAAGIDDDTTRLADALKRDLAASDIPDGPNRCLSRSLTSASRSPVPYTGRPASRLPQITSCGRDGHTHPFFSSDQDHPFNAICHAASDGQ